MPFSKTLVAKTGNNEKKYVLKIGKYEINLLNTSTNFEKYDTMNDVKKLTLFGKFEVPVELKTITYEEYLSDDISYTKEEALELAKEGALMQAYENIPKEVEIINSEYKIFYTEEEVIVRATVECVEKVRSRSRGRRPRRFDLIIMNI